jgi:hypothetical protein
VLPATLILGLINLATGVVVDSTLCLWVALFCFASGWLQLRARRR